MERELRYEKLNYNSYLKISDLLGLQKRLSNPPHKDEMFFIIIHQTMELWFKEILHETQFLREAFREQRVSSALKVLKRNTAIVELLVKHINLLSTLTPVEFAGFRDELMPASGFQSIQFRQMEYTYGVKEPIFLQFFPKGSEENRVLTQLQKEPTVYDDFLQCLSDSGYGIPKEVLERDFSQNYEGNGEIEKLLVGLYESLDEDYHWVLLLEAMLDFDEKFLLWRNTHILMVERTIGRKRGTGGSSGVSFLEKRLHYKFFPDIWSARNSIGTEYT